MKRDKLEKMLDEVFDENVKYSFKRAETQTVAQFPKRNAPQYKIKTHTSNFGLRGTTFKKLDRPAKHKDMFYFINHYQDCVVHYNNPFGPDHSFGVEFYTTCYIDGNVLNNIEIHASFKNNDGEVRNPAYDSLKGSIDIWYKFSERSNSWESDVNCSTFNSKDMQEVQKHASALMLAERVVVQKCKHIKDSIYQTSQLELCDDYLGECL